MSELANWEIGARNLMTRWSLSTFVETGCLNGNSLEQARAMGFTKLFSCDTDPCCVAVTQQRIPEAWVSNTDSVSFLRAILPSILDPVLFYLVAYFPSTGNPAQWFPVYDELEVIKCLKSGVERDVILVDDLRCFNDERNPFFGKGMGRSPHTHEHAVVADYVAFTQSLEATHHYHGVLTGEGCVGIFSPKTSG